MEPSKRPFEPLNLAPSTSLRSPFLWKKSSSWCAMPSSSAAWKKKTSCCETSWAIVTRLLVARALHAASLRAKGPFVEVNCAAIPEELIESELFGHIKGSFTGATEDKIGKFQKADGGTLFLDEIGDMSLRTQSKVLRVLEEQRFERVGSNVASNVDVRVVAATNKNLEQEISRGAFRQDLFYRLNVIPFYVPPLRDRREDIPTLANYFLREFSSGYSKKTRELSEAAMEILLRYPWPGNVRELRNLVERLVIVCPQARIEPHHLPP